MILLGFGDQRNRGRSSILTIVIVLSTHFSILGDAPLAGLATDKGATHGTGEHTAGDDENGGSEDNPTPPAHVRDKEQDVDEKSEQGDEERGQLQDQQGQEITRRMRGLLEVRSEGHQEAYEGEKGGDRVDDQDGRKRPSRTRWKVKVVGVERGEIIYGHT